MTPQQLSSILRNTTCGELSCDDCNQQRIDAADMIDRLVAELAECRKRCGIEEPEGMQ